MTEGVQVEICGVFLGGLHEPPPQQSMESDEFADRTTVGEVHFGAVIAVDTLHNFHGELDLQVLEGEADALHNLHNFHDEVDLQVLEREGDALHTFHDELDLQVLEGEGDALHSFHGELELQVLDGEGEAQHNFHDELDPQLLEGEGDTLLTFHDELDPQLPEGEGEGEGEEKQQECIPDPLHIDTQPGAEQSKGDGDASGEAERVEAPPAQVPWTVIPPGSKPQGVSFHKNNKQWEAHLWIKNMVLRGRKKKGVQIFMGNYGTVDEAKDAHDRAAIRFNVRASVRGKPYPLNFPESRQAAFMAEHRDWTARDFLWKLRRYSLKFSSGICGMKGVSVRKYARKRRKRGEEQVPAEPVLRFEAKICLTQGRKMTCCIGTFGSEEEAGRAYDRALLYINRDKEEVEQWHVITNFRPSSYTADEILLAGSKLNFK